MRDALMNSKSQKGAAIMVVAATIAVLAGAITLGMVASSDSMSEADKALKTRVKMERVMDHLAAFAQMHGRLPCRADPAIDPQNAVQNSQNFGFEDRNNAGNGCNGFRGIVPFRSLGLQEYDVKDAWGRLISYYASPVFGNLDGILVATPNTTVFPGCRIDTTWVSGEQRFDLLGVALNDIRNRNPAKALFCCPPIGQDGVANLANEIRINNAAGAALPIRAGFFLGRDDTGVAYGTMNTSIGVSVANWGNPVTWAVALVSHGTNGLGSWAMNNNQMPGAAGNELENADNDTVLVDAYITRANPATYFDDIVVYRNNWQLMAELNNGSCNRPFR